ncbi:hypothetical protein [Arthrobacter sp. NPDC090010]|uniref:hypothetical protein n=1 Tax=Arthrobacter sp. NPDC090010 TaxID=3363942 RepID=UPI00380A7D58
MSRILAVSRMQLVNKWTFLGMPGVILGGAFVLSLAIFALVPGEKYSGGASFAPLWYFFALGLQSLTMTFPFALGMSVSRRSYFLGTYATFAAVALGMALLYTVGTQLEAATSGWGMNGYFFRTPFLFDGPWWQSLALSFVITMFFFSTGFWSATVYKRWGVTGALIMGIGVALIVLAAVFLLTWTGNWAAVGEFFAHVQGIGLAGVVLVLVAAMSLGGYLTIRRATA